MPRIGLCSPCCSSTRRHRIPTYIRRSCRTTGRWALSIDRCRRCSTHRCNHHHSGTRLGNCCQSTHRGCTSGSEALRSCPRHHSFPRQSPLHHNTTAGDTSWWDSRTSCGSIRRCHRSSSRRWRRSSGSLRALPSSDRRRRSSGCTIRTGPCTRCHSRRHRRSDPTRTHGPTSTTFRAGPCPGSCRRVRTPCRRRRRPSRPPCRVRRRSSPESLCCRRRRSPSRHASRPEARRCRRRPAPLGTRTRTRTPPPRPTARPARVSRSAPYDARRDTSTLEPHRA